MQYRYYQIEAADGVKNAARRGIGRQVIALPTGSGKTLVFAKLITMINPLKRKAEGKRAQVVVLAHTRELLEQAQDKILAVNPGLKIGIEMAELTADPNCDVILGSVKTLAHKNSTRIFKLDPSRIAMVITDEAHHSVAEGYETIYRHLGIPNKIEGVQPKCLHVAVTATPIRGDGINLGDVYDEVVYQRTTLDLTPEFLVPPRHIAIDSKIRLNKVKKGANGDFSTSQLSSLLNTKDHNALIVNSYKLFGENRRTLLFAIDVAHAEELLIRFREAGISSELIIGSTPKAKRFNILERFKAGEFKVLLSVETLCEGFDDPGITCLMMARPTMSWLLLIQQVGRGTRRMVEPGTDTTQLDAQGKPVKPDFLILEFTHSHSAGKVASVSGIYNLPWIFNGQGENLYELNQKYEQLVEAIGIEYAEKVRNAEELEKALKNVDAFKKRMKKTQDNRFYQQKVAVGLSYAEFAWYRIGDGSWRLSLGSGQHFVVQSNILGHYDIGLREERLTKMFDTYTTQEEAIHGAEDFIRKNIKRALPLVKLTAPWRQGEISLKQFTLAKRIRIFPKEAKLKDITLTKGQLSVLIDQRMPK